MTSDRNNPNRPDATGVFHPMSVRILTERDKRAEESAFLMNYCNPFLDDFLRGMMRQDLVLISAPSGVGKTDFALNIAVENAKRDRRVGFFALEAKPQELEQRVKFSWIATEAWRRNLDRRGELNYKDWLVHRCEDIVGGLDDAADEWITKNLSTLWTFYRGDDFGQSALTKAIRDHAHLFDLFVIDHLHYIDFDSDEETENRAIAATMKAIRTVQQETKKPVILVAHLRKSDRRLKQLVPELEDISGTKHVVNIATQGITIAPALNIEAPKWWLAPTYIAVRKDRDGGSPPFVALTMFDKRNRSYQDTYSLGRLTKGGTEWEEIKAGDRPGWATSFKQLEMELG